MSFAVATLRAGYKGVNIKVEIEDQTHEGPWTEAGDWFKSFIELGVSLSRLSLSPTFGLSRVLITVPKKEYVAAAIAIGFSIQKFLERQTHAREIPMDGLADLKPGTLVRLEWTQGPRDVVFESYEVLPQRDTFRRRVTCKIDGTNKIFDLHAVKKVYVLPEGFPEGNHFDKSNEEGAPERTGAQEFWRAQEAPALAIFGDVGHFHEQIQTRIRYEALSHISEGETMTIGEVARIDFLSNDIYAHFVNIFEQFNKFPKTGTPEAKKVALCDWILLDGNNATSKLAGKETLIDARSISLIEMGLPRSQGKALEAFTAELNNFRSINAQVQLNWNPPAGVRIWGWAK
jgi:hypothetical protein